MTNKFGEKDVSGIDRKTTEELIEKAKELFEEIDVTNRNEDIAHAQLYNRIIAELEKRGYKITEVKTIYVDKIQEIK